MKSKIPELIEALTGRFSDHHAFLAQLYLDEIDTHTRTVDALTARIEVAIRRFESARAALVTIPGVSTLVADVLIAEPEPTWLFFPMPVTWHRGLEYVRVPMSRLVESSRLRRCPAISI
jgi:transposase